MHSLIYDFSTGILEDSEKKIGLIKRTIADTIDIYENKDVTTEKGKELAYFVQSHDPQPNIEGALQFGTSNLLPGDINGEFYMTKGHTHEIENRAEYYFGIKGNGLLLLMDENRNTKIEEVHSNSLHYIEGYVAHRLVNIGDTTLVVGACWNADAGHNYDAISEDGFSVRIMKSDNELGYEIRRGK